MFKHFTEVWKSKLWFIVVILVLSGLLAGCATKEKANEIGKTSPTPPTNAQPTQQPNQQPNQQSSNQQSSNQQTTSQSAQEEKVTLTFWGYHLPDNIFKSEIVEPVSKKYPNITLQLMRPSAKYREEKEPIIPMVLNDEGPDIIFGPNSYYISIYHENGILEDLQPWIKRYNIQLNAFDPYYIDEIMTHGKGQLGALPYQRELSALVYNLDVFDHLKVQYPRDGMSWDEVIELAKRLHVQEGDQQYIGLLTMGQGSLSRQLSLQHVDAAGNPAVNHPHWLHYFSILQTVNQFSELFQPVTQDMIRDKNLAMVMGSMPMLHGLYEEEQSPYRWDLVSFPIIHGLPEVVPGLLENFLALNPRGSQKELSFQVIQLLISPEIQLENSRKGSPSPLTQIEIHQAYGADNPHLKGKNIAALYRYLAQGDYVQPHPYDSLARGQVFAIERSIIGGDKGIAEGIAEMEAKIKEVIAEQEKLK